MGLGLTLVSGLIIILLFCATTQAWQFVAISQPNLASTNSFALRYLDLTTPSNPQTQLIQSYSSNDIGTVSGNCMTVDTDSGLVSFLSVNLSSTINYFGQLAIPSGKVSSFFGVPVPLDALAFNPLNGQLFSAGIVEKQMAVLQMFPFNGTAYVNAFVPTAGGGEDVVSPGTGAYNPKGNQFFFMAVGSSNVLVTVDTVKQKVQYQSPVSADVQCLMFDPATENLYAVVTPLSDTEKSRGAAAGIQLVQIDPSTGAMNQSIGTFQLYDQVSACAIGANSTAVISGISLSTRSISTILQISLSTGSYVSSALNYVVVGLQDLLLNQ